MRNEALDLWWMGAQTFWHGPCAEPDIEEQAGNWERKEEKLEAPDHNLY